MKQKVKMWTELLTPPEIASSHLRCLRPHIPDQVAAGPDAGLEHEVELEGRGDVVAGLGGLRDLFIYLIYFVSVLSCV